MIAASDVDFPGTGRTGHEHEPLRQVREVLDRRRQAELLERRELHRDHAHAHRERAHLEVAVGAEPGDAVVGEREVDLAVGAQLLLEIVGEHAQHELLDVVLVERRLARDRDELPVDAHQRRAERGDQQVAAARAPTARRGSARSGQSSLRQAHAWILRLGAHPIASSVSCRARPVRGPGLRATRDAVLRGSQDQEVQPLALGLAISEMFPLSSTL